MNIYICFNTSYKMFLKVLSPSVFPAQVHHWPPLWEESTALPLSAGRVDQYHLCWLLCLSSRHSQLLGLDFQVRKHCYLKLICQKYKWLMSSSHVTFWATHSALFLCNVDILTLNFNKKVEKYSGQRITCCLIYFRLCVKRGIPGSWGDAAGSKGLLPNP